ncbi:hypothetical protein LOAG_09782 [Loa loa]|uniref:Uncharacterized protein n=1 Tax=Loa loa TaxID=7209 RepID=A0A1S0TR06_LOALO|nr:hypothetical protein LOAG_09782 [Loa loa]EFO18714.1 hypothetical protein LOAG_09782 [Loa loa]
MYFYHLLSSFRSRKWPQIEESDISVVAHHYLPMSSLLFPVNAMVEKEEGDYHFGIYYIGDIGHDNVIRVAVLHLHLLPYIYDDYEIREDRCHYVMEMNFLMEE